MSELIDAVQDWIDDGGEKETARLVSVIACFAVCVVAAVAAITFAASWIINEHPRWLLALIAPALYGAWRYVRWLFNIENKEKTDGGDRQAEEDSQDSGSFATGGYVPPTLTIGPSTVAGSGTNLTRQMQNAINLQLQATVFGMPPKTKADVPQVEEVEGDQPILAHRAAVLRFDGTDNHFGSVNVGLGTFGVDADAACGDMYGIYAFGGGSKRHAAPEVGCSCGFYALPPDMRSTYEGRSYVQLLVELSGTVIEHEQGYRAGHQSVVECQLPACQFCGAQASSVVVEDGAMTHAHCGRHRWSLKPGQTVVAAEDVQHLIGVPVTRLGRPSELAQ